MRWTAAMMAALALGCVGPVGETFVGSWAGAYTCRGEDQDGAPVSEGGPQTIRIERGSDGELVIAGRCVIPITATSDRVATMAGYDCRTALEDGTPARVVYEPGGTVQLSGDFERLAYAYQLTVIIGGGVFYMGCAFEGTRS